MLTNNLFRGIAGKGKSSGLGVDLHGPAESLLSAICHAETQNIIIAKYLYSKLQHDQSVYKTWPACWPLIVHCKAVLGSLSLKVLMVYADAMQH